MISKSVIIEPNAVTVVETAYKLIRKNKNIDNFFTRSYVEELYNYSIYCKESRKEEWYKDIDLTFNSIYMFPKKDIINKLDLLESTGIIMMFMDKKTSKQEIDEYILEAGISGERLFTLLCYMLVYSKYGIEFYKEYIGKNPSLENELLNNLYINARIDRAKERERAIKEP